MRILHNGKDFIIPVTMHKVKNKLEVNCATMIENTDLSIPDESETRGFASQISQEIDNDKNEALKKNA